MTNWKTGLTAKQVARVARETTKRIGHNPDRTKAEYSAELAATAAALYPAPHVLIDGTDCRTVYGTCTHKAV